MENQRNILELCLDEIASIESCFDLPRGKCANPGMARDGLAQLKAVWKQRADVAGHTAGQLTISKALCRIKVKTNSRPDTRWLNDLDGARFQIQLGL